MAQRLNSGERDREDYSFLDSSDKMLSEVVLENTLKDFHGDIRVAGVGDIIEVMHNVDMLRDADMRIFLQADKPENYSFLKVLSSLGVSCGLWIDAKTKAIDERIVDLAAHHFMSPAPHASIEPFEFIITHIDDELNLSPLDMYDKWEKACDGTATDFDAKLSAYYSHFIELDQCSKCKAFRICRGTLKDILNDCEQTMGEVLDCLVVGYRLRKEKRYADTNI